jgi:hypothetical protein
MRIVLTILLACVLSIWAVATYVIDAHAGPYRALAEQLERSADGKQDPRYMARIEKAMADTVILLVCSREIARSAVSIRLAILDAAHQTGDAAAEKRALANATDTLNRSLRCFPRDGNLWLRLAMVEHARTGPTKAVEDMLRASHAAAPSDAWVMGPRIRFASRLAGSELPGIDAVLLADIDSLVGYGSVPDIAELYVGGGEPIRSALQVRFQKLDPDRRDAIERAVAWTVSQAKPKK